MKYVLLFFNFISIISFAQNREALDKALDAISSHKNSQLSFVKNVNQKLFNKTKTETGELYLSQKKFKLILNSKPSEKVIFDGVNLWILQGEKDDLQIIKSKQSRTKKIPIISLFQRKSQASSFKILNSTKLNNLNQFEVSLNNPSFNQKIYISVDPANNSLKEISYTDEAENEVKYSITRIKNELTLSEKFFSFNPPKNAKVITE